MTTTPIVSASHVDPGPVKPIAFFVIGPAGSGKSTVGKAIARQYGAAYLDKDTLVTAFTEWILEANGFDKDERDNNAFYQATVLPLEYETLLRTCGDNLRVGTSVVLDAPFGRYFAQPDYLETARQRHRWPDVTLIVVHVRVDGHKLLDRLVERDNNRDGWKIEHWDQFWDSTQGSACQWDSAQHIVVDNNDASMDLRQFDRNVHFVSSAAVTTA